MAFDLNNIGATYQYAIMALFHDLMHREIEIYINNMISKWRKEKNHVDILKKKLFEKLKKYKSRLYPIKCTFKVWSGRLLEFVTRNKGIKVN
jgi:hypothetical protein